MRPPLARALVLCVGLLHMPMMAGADEDNARRTGAMGTIKALKIPARFKQAAIRMIGPWRSIVAFGNYQNAVSAKTKENRGFGSVTRSVYASTGKKAVNPRDLEEYSAVLSTMRRHEYANSGRALVRQVYPLADGRSIVRVKYDRYSIEKTVRQLRWTGTERTTERRVPQQSATRSWLLDANGKRLGTISDSNGEIFDLLTRHGIRGGS